MIFNIEAAVVIGIIAAMFLALCKFIPSLSGSAPPFILAALTFAVGATTEFVLGLRPRIGIVIPIWLIGVVIFATNIMVFFGPILFYGLILILGIAFVAVRIRGEHSRWHRAEVALVEYGMGQTSDPVERLGFLRDALFCNSWTRTSALYAKHNITVLEFLQRDVPEQFTQDELEFLRSISIDAQTNYRTALIRKIRAFLFHKADLQGIGRFR